MSEQSTGVSLAAIWDTARGKLISFLVIVFLILGLISEVISVVTGYYNMHKVRCDLALSAIQVTAQGMSPAETLSGKSRRNHDFLGDCLNY